MNLYSSQQTIQGDLLTPVAVLLRLDAPGTFLYESVVGSETVARYSIIGASPLIQFELYPSYIKMIQDGVHQRHEGNPLDYLSDWMANLTPQDLLGDGFTGGLVGYFHWDAISLFEPCIPWQHDNLIGHHLIPGVVVRFDHLRRTITVVGWSFESEMMAQQTVHDTLKRLHDPIGHPELTTLVSQPVQASMTQSQFEAMVVQAKSHIRDGDVFQMVLSQSFEVTSNESPLAVYRRLRQNNPSPYMVYMNWGDWHIVGSSPEMLTKLTNGRAISRPIAGTRPRNAAHPDQDADLIASLTADAKEVAEHVMLVDLARNDLGRVCHHINWQDLMSIDRYSHVLHMVSTVTGQLNEGVTGFDLLKATFPAGTLSGAPKLKAITLINQIEPVNRGLYGGIIGLMSFHQDMDWCIAIRCATHHRGTYRIQAGGGIVADSDPITEWHESRNKALAVIKACGGHL